MEETLDSVNDDEELEDEADAEVDKVLFELTDGKLGQAGKVGADLPVRRCLYRPFAQSLTSGGAGRGRRGRGRDAADAEGDAGSAEWISGLRSGFRPLPSGYPRDALANVVDTISLPMMIVHV